MQTIGPHQTCSPATQTHAHMMRSWVKSRKETRAAWLAGGVRLERDISARLEARGMPYFRGNFRNPKIARNTLFPKEFPELCAQGKVRLLLRAVARDLRLSVNSRWIHRRIHRLRISPLSVSHASFTPRSCPASPSLELSRCGVSLLPLAVALGAT